ncbi:glycoside hydrolase family 3 protein [Periconia macrospinosa]|uniref:Probable beta-glucosidase G n=1 Tax=Periconia macrospinosa TaxID=97972 RepID=A0A2V1DSK5_9PLEO|nr:glycoside hydrolase family 3 protein [Periconia macrospinosa]
MVTSTALTWLALAAASNAQFGIKHTQYGTSPPVYPSPNITGSGGWEAALGKARAFLAELTLEEKSQMVTGTPGPCVGNLAPIPRLNFSGLCLQDGPLAIRQSIYSSVFPAQLTAAASWDRNLTRAHKGSHVILGPVVGPLGRTPYGGRNWEGYSPDAYLSGVLVEETVHGMQSTGVQACTKHFIGNEQEIQRNPTTVNGKRVEAISSNIDDRTMHETYLWPFANAVHAGTTSIMCSYQRLNGSYGCQNSKTLNGLLKEELGFNGWVMSDWMATHAGVATVEAGLDVNMPGGISFTQDRPSYWGANLTTAVNNGTLDISRLDDMVLRVLTPYYWLNQDSGFPQVDGSTVPISFFSKRDWRFNFTLGPTVDVRADHHKLIRELGAAGTVLLKNENNTLPLKKPINIGVFGNDAADLTAGQYSLGSYSLLAGGDYEIGTLPVGGGSGAGRYPYVVAPLDAIKTRAQSYGALVQYVIDDKLIAGGALRVLQPSLPDVCIVFLKSWATEGDDRKTLIADWNSTAVVVETAKHCPSTVVVLHGAAPNVLPWKDNENVTAILAAHMPGQETGNSIVDILWGDVNPSGKLPYTIANNETDYIHLVNSTELLASTDPDAWQDDFTEGNLIDYKQFEYQNKSVAYEFGFGLSYTNFSLSDLDIQVPATNVSRLPSASAKIVPGGNEDLWKVLATVSATVKNTGDVRGATVPQLYIKLPTEAGKTQNVKALRGFEKVQLAEGAEARVVFNLMRRDLSYWDTTAQQWRLPTSVIKLAVGFSSKDLKIAGELSI